jgi:glycopeptide antibiotics resistance protein
MRSAGGRPGVNGSQRRAGRPSRWVRMAALVYVAVLAVVTLRPTGGDSRLARWPHNHKLQLVPFEGILFGFGSDSLETLTEAFGNVLLFVPFGFLLPLLVPVMRRWWHALAIGTGVSLGIELYQIAWLGRWADVNDLLMNALGALLGFAALRLTETLLGRQLR